MSVIVDIAVAVEKGLMTKDEGQKAVKEFIANELKHAKIALSNAEKAKV